MASKPWIVRRAVAKAAFLKSRGLVTAGGKIKRGQASLDAMAEFTAREMGGMAPDLDRGLRDGSLSYAQANRGLGKRYIKWRYDDPRYAHHHRFRDQHRNRVAALVEKRGEPRPIVSENAGVMLQNYAGNSARLGNSTAAALGTMTSRNQAITNHINTTVNQTVQKAVQAPKAVADAVGAAASAAPSRLPASRQNRRRYHEIQRLPGQWKCHRAPIRATALLARAEPIPVIGVG